MHLYSNLYEVIFMKLKFGEDINFGIKEKRQLNGPVITYKLPTEEHAKYKDQETLKLNKVRELARTFLYKPKQIMEMTGYHDLKKIQRIVYHENNKLIKQNRKGGFN